MNTPNIRRYIRIMAWSYRRYVAEDSNVLITHRRRQPTKYTRIELAAAKRYLGIAS